MKSVPPRIFAKSYEASEYERLEMKYQALGAGVASLGFIVPQTSFVREEYRIDFEWIDDAEPLGDVLASLLRVRATDEFEALLRRAGAALADLHVLLTDQIISRDTAVQRLLQNQVVLHGDYGFANVLVTKSGHFGIIDFEPSIILAEFGHVGPPEIDLAMMYSCLAGRRQRAIEVWKFFRNRDRALHSLVAGYIEQRNGEVALDVRLLRAIAAHLVRTRADDYSGVKRYVISRIARMV